MTPLPDRRKSQEELDALRQENLRAAGLVPHSQASPEEAEEEFAELDERPAVRARELEIHPRREKAPAPSVAAPPLEPAEPVLPAVDAVTEAAPVRLKARHSLRRKDPPLAKADPASRRAHQPIELPDQKMDRIELQQLRTSEIADPEVPANYLRSLAAHPALITLGYLLAIAAGVEVYLAGSWIPAAVCLAPALLVALVIAIRSPRSRHHAGFIATIAFFVGFYGYVHFFN